jgi:tRNA A-37 threonylcarbamoyl transferase component Bud32
MLVGSTGGEFAGTARFQLVRKLGEGGMGVVYEAHDRDRGARVALKTLRLLGAEALLRLKNEFRAMQDLEHPNLVSMRELFEHEGHWFLTMELVEGAVSFVEYVRPAPALRIGDMPTVPDGRAEPTAASSAAHREEPAFDEPRLRASLAQLARGLGALHAARMVHRDIKPSNVVVAPTGRVTILDFGLIAGFAQHDSPLDDEVLGTFAFMAPEQVVSSAVGPEADWYAVGVMLYVALTGRLPLRGRSAEMLTLKQVTRPDPPRTLVPAVPEDLDRLCCALLAIEPASRATLRDVLAAVEGDPESAPRRPSESRFVGRSRELGALGAALDEVRHGRACALVVHGESGIGKSALVRRFAQSADRAVVLASRCYEREAVPYKGVDGVIDALSRHLAALEDDAWELPPDVALLAQVFPVLRKVDAIADLPPVEEPLDRQSLRARVFAALRALFARLASRVPVVLAIDDLQWADADSLALLAEVMRPPEAPLVLLLVTMRRAQESEGEFRTIADVRAALGAAPDARREGIALHELALAGLPEADARELVRSLAGASAIDPARIAQAAAGHPLFIDELVRHALSDSDRPPASAPLDAALWRRVQRLDATARGVMEIVATGAPVARDVVETAAEAVALDKDVAALRAARLVKTAGERIEPYHDRIRAAVLRNMTGEAKAACHRRLALALEGRADAETLSVHWRGAGDLARAAAHAERAAEEASAALAFDRAARLYRQALELRPRPDDEAAPLQARLGDALANAGRAVESASAYLSASPHVGPEESLDLRRRAADQLLRSGHLDEGLAVVSDLLKSIGAELPRSQRGALVSLLFRRARLRLRGLAYQAKTPAEVAPAALGKIDTMWSVSTGLGLADIIRGTDFQTRGTLLALDAGEPYRVARALSAEAGFTAAAGGPARARTVTLLAAADAAAQKSGRVEAFAIATAARGLAEYVFGDFRVAHEHCDAAHALLRDRCRNVFWELHTAQLYSCFALVYRGKMSELARRVPAILREASAQGNKYAATSVRTATTNLLWLALDDPDRARDELVVGMRDWSRIGFHLQHHWTVMAETQIDLYKGDVESAYRRVAESWSALERSLLLRVQIVRVEAVYLRARAALALAARTHDAARLAEAARFAARLAKEKMAWIEPIAALMHAGVAARRGDSDGTRRGLERAVAGFDAAEMELYAAAARVRLAAVVGGAEGSKLRADAAAWMRAEGVVNGEGIVATLAPGFGD